VLFQVEVEAAKYHAAVVEQMRVAQEQYNLEKDVALRKVEKNMRTWWTSQMDQRITALVAAHQIELAKAYSRLAGIEKMIDSVAEAGRYARCLCKPCSSIIMVLEFISILLCSFG